MSVIGDLAYWQRLNGNAVAGELELDPSVASGIQSAVDEFIAGLDVLKNQAGRLGNVTGVGGLDSAKELAAKFGDKAIGSGGLVK